MKIVIAGGSGFIGKALLSYLQTRGHHSLALSRKGEFFWDPETKQIDLALLEGADVVINLAGESILGRWNARKMQRIRESRLVATQFLCDSLLRLDVLPRLYLNASAIGYYGDRGNDILTEASSSGEGFLAEVSRDWEHIPDILEKRGVRVAFLRLGLILGAEGGALKLMLKPFQMGMGGTLGSGKQMMSWMALEDVLRGIEWVMAHEELKGPLNFVSPHPVSNAEFTKLFAQLLHRPASLPIPKFALSMLFGSGAEVFLASTHVLPEKLLKSGFTFEYPHLEEALKKYLISNPLPSNE